MARASLLLPLALTAALLLLTAGCGMCQMSPQRMEQQLRRSGELTSLQHQQLKAHLVQLLRGAVLALRPTAEQKESAAEAARESLRHMHGNEPLLDVLRAAIKCGVPGVLPPMDPVDLPGPTRFPVAVPDTDIEFNLTLMSTTMMGLAGFNGILNQSISYLPPGMTVKLRLFEPRISFNTAYHAQNISERLAVWGDGTFRLLIRDLHMSGLVTVGLRAFGNFRVKHCDINVEKANAAMNITGLYGGGMLNEVVADVVNILLKEAMPELLTELSAIISDAVKEIGNEVLKGLTFNDRVSLISKMTYG